MSNNNPKKNVIMIKLLLSLFLLSVISINSSQAQQTITASGGEASGNGGSSSYTVGQTVYSTDEGSNGNSISQGVQQPYEISVVTGIIPAKDINLSFSAYPNPTTNYLTIKVENYETSNLQYVVYDINGKLLQKVKARGIETKIETNKLVPAIYFVKVLDDKKEIKIFKFIKN